MKRIYDVIGYGEGISGIFAGALLAGKGLSCLWVDTSPGNPGFSLWPETGLFLTDLFSKTLLGPILNSIDPGMMRSLKPEYGLLVKCIDRDGGLSFDQGMTGRNRLQSEKAASKYLSILRRSFIRPHHFLGKLGRSAPGYHDWEKIIGSAFGSPTPDRISLLRAQAIRMGMCAMGYGRIKEALKAYLKRGRGGDYIKRPGAGLVMDGGRPLGLQIDDIVYKGHFYLTEDLAGQGTIDGFYLYGQCRARLGMLPHDMGDLMVIPPPDELEYPIMLRVTRNPDAPRVMIRTRVDLEHGLTSSPEIMSWASGMVVKRLSRLMPFLAGPLKEFEVVNPMENDVIRPWFRFSRGLKPPSLFNRRRYINPTERIYACDRDRYACLGEDGDFFWGVCIANVILKDLGRSDLIIVKPS